MAPRSRPLLYRQQQRQEDAQRIARILEESGTTVPATKPSAGATAPGDGRRLRGIPAVARGTSGAMFGSDPVRALLAKERRLRR